MILFPDQEIVLEKARQKLRSIKLGARKPRILIQAPCGFGKTAVAAFIARSVSERSLPSWFICHRDFLLSQTSLTFDNVGIPHSFMAAGRDMDTSSLTHIGMVGSLKARASRLQTPAVCVWDEAHHMPAKTWAAQMDAMPDTIHVGLSATPGGRTDGQGLGDFFDDIVIGPSVAELIAKKRLANYEYYIPSKPDFSGVHVQAGEYVHAEAVDAMKSVIVGDIVATYRRNAHSLRAVYFATSIELSKKYAEAFNAAGIPAAHMDKDTPADERTCIAQSMARGELKVICNVFICAEGYDLAAQAGMAVMVDVVGLCFRTKSLPKLIQCMMRCMRAGARGIIFDHGNNFEEHNFLPDDEIKWSLNGAKRSELVGTYQCVGCGAVLRRGSGVCSHCGTNSTERIAEIKARKEVEHIAGELAKVERERRIIEAEAEKKEAARKRNVAINMCKSYSDLVNVGKKYGYSKGWAGVQYKLRFKKG